MKKTIIVLLLFLCAFSGCITAFKYTNFKSREQEIKQELENTKENINEKVQEDPVFKDGILGMIVIPSLNVEAEIKEGTGSEILKYFVRTF